ncbi:MAG: hypothetical protein Q9174_002117 [Haloplaca sp. 1 TL-2023]
MSGQRRASSNGLPLPNLAGTNLFPGFELPGNGLINPASFDTFQPSFGQTWSGVPGWTMPLTNYNFLQTGFAPNQSIFPNQHYNQPFEGNDNFCANDSAEMGNATEVDDDRRGPRSLEPLQRTVERSDQGLAFPNNQGEAAPKNTTSSPLSKADATTRAAELRTRLLASKRPGSATPAAKSASVIPDGKPKSPGVAKGNKMSLKEVSTHPAKDSKANAISSVAKSDSTRLSVDKSTKAPQNPPNPSPANADIEGLLGEYRRPKPSSDIKVKLPPTTNTEVIVPKSKPASGMKVKLPPTMNTKAIVPKSPAKATKDAPGDGSQGKQASVAGLPTHVSSQRDQQESLGSSESGEIHSDQELSNSGLRKHKGAQSSDMVAEGVQVEEAEAPTALDAKPGKAVKAIQCLANGPTRTAIEPSSSRNTPARKSDQGPLAQSASTPRQISRDRENQQFSKGPERLRSPRRVRDISPRRVSNQVQQGGVKDHSQVPTSTGSETGIGRSGRLPTVDDGRTGVPAEHKRNSLEKPTETKESQPMQSSTQHSQGRSSPTGTDLTTSRSVTVPAKGAVERPAPSTNEVSHHTTSNGSDGSAVKSPLGYTLTQAQHEQMQKLGLELSTNGLHDLFDFLEFHGFHNEEYRAVVVEEHRGLKAIREQQKALEEKQLAAERKVHDQFQSMRARSVALRESIERPASMQHKDDIQPAAPSSIRPMLPPLTLPKRPDKPRTYNNDGLDGIVSTGSPAAQTPRSQVQSAIKPISTKREQVDDDHDYGPTRKTSRTDYGPRTSRSEHGSFERRYSDYRPASFDFRGRSGSPINRGRTRSPYRENGAPSYPSRHDSWGSPSVRDYPGGLGFRKADVTSVTDVIILA